MRPTAEAVRVQMMKLLAGDLAGARVADLFAGTGALGLEALSRGAKYVDFVEFRPSSLHALKANIAALRVSTKCRVYKKDALPFAENLTHDRYDIAFVDPPYESRMLDRLIERWQREPWSRVLVAEHLKTHVLPKGATIHVLEDTSISVYRAPIVAPVVAPVVDTVVAPSVPPTDSSLEP